MSLYWIGVASAVWTAVMMLDVLYGPWDELQRVPSRYVVARLVMLGAVSASVSYVLWVVVHA